MGRSTGNVEGNACKVVLQTGPALITAASGPGCVFLERLHDCAVNFRALSTLGRMDELGLCLTWSIQESMIYVMMRAYVVVW
jgi:hypothetical protein